LHGATAVVGLGTVVDVVVVDVVEVAGTGVVGVVVVVVVEVAGTAVGEVLVVGAGVLREVDELELEFTSLLST
jgi:uncharacterized protein (DUF697 family)